MKFNFTQIFLLVWIIAFWACYFLTFGKIEDKYEKSIKTKYGTETKWGPLFGLAFPLWTILIFIYFFNYNSVNWLWRISFLDNNPIKIIAIAIICFAFLLNILFTISVAKSIKIAFSVDEKPRLVTSGIYSYIRHPGYLGFFGVAFGTFLIIPNILSLVLLLYTYIVIYGHTLEEEKKLMRIYGKEYEQFKNDVGRFLPKLKRGLVTIIMYSLITK